MHQHMEAEGRVERCVGERQRQQIGGKKLGIGVDVSVGKGENEPVTLTAVSGKTF